ncbi:MAG: hypothetical protein MZW92_56100 [Comamonadaceae bacterium]|nr:hypothetical protein [Comamonadaceae bacterium]
MIGAASRQAAPRFARGAPAGRHDEPSHPHEAAARLPADRPVLRRASSYAESHADWAADFATSHFGAIVSGGVVGPTEAPVLLATVVVIVATLAQVLLAEAARPQGRHDAVGQPGAGRRARRR